MSDDVWEETERALRLGHLRARCAGWCAKLLADRGRGREVEGEPQVEG